VGTSSLIRLGRERAVLVDGSVATELETFFAGAGLESPGLEGSWPVRANGCWVVHGVEKLELDRSLRGEMSRRGESLPSLRLVEFPKLQATGLFFCLLRGLIVTVPPWIIIRGRLSNTVVADRKVAGESLSSAGVSGICMFNS